MRQLEGATWEIFCRSSDPTKPRFRSPRNRLLVFENSFSPAVDSPRRPIKKSLTPTGTRTATRENPTRCFFWRRSQNRKTLNALPPHARYIGACEKG